MITADVGADGRPDRDPARPPRRRPRPRRAVRAARRGRPPDRPRRLRHEGRAGGDDVRASATAPRRTRARALRLRARRGVRRRRRPLDRRAGPRPACAATSPSPASRPTCTSASQAKGVLALRIEVAGRAPRLDAVAGRQRGAQGDGRLPPDRGAAVQPRVLRALRPALDQPRADPRRRRLQQGARPLLRWTSTSATCPARTRARSSPRSARCPTSMVKDLHPPAGDRVAHATRTCARCARPSAAVEGEALSVGRDGASDAVSFLEAGIPAVEFGPSAAATTAPRSGSRSPRSRATARRWATSCARCPLARARPRRRRGCLRRSRAGWRERLRACPPPRGAGACGCASSSAALVDRRADRRRHGDRRRCSRSRSVVDRSSARRADHGHRRRALARPTPASRRRSC